MLNGWMGKAKSNCIGVILGVGIGVGAGAGVGAGVGDGAGASRLWRWFLDLFWGLTLVSSHTPSQSSC